jgi:hypothetical protein
MASQRRKARGLVPVSLVRDEALPWADPLNPEARLLGRLATLLSMMATEAAMHPEEYREPPDAKTLRQLSEVLLRVACTDDPTTYFREAMRQWRQTWVERGGPEEQARLDWDHGPEE